MILKPFFSIVTISYNQADFVADTIRSVLDQSFSDFEYIIQDPGSTDGSRDIISSFTDKRIRIYFETDEGPADGLNRGFSKATGKYYLYLNSDDLLMRTALEYMHHFLLKIPDCDVLCGAASSVDSFGNHLRYLYPDRPTKLMMAHSASIIIQPSTAIKSSSFLKVNGFNPLNKSNWDGEIYADLFMCGAYFRIVPAVLSKYRLHPNSITSTDRLSLLRKEWSDRCYTKITKKDPIMRSKLVSLFCRYARKILNPRDTYETIFHGKQLGRSS